MLVLERFTLLAWVYVTYNYINIFLLNLVIILHYQCNINMLARGGFYTSTSTRASHYCML